MSGDYVSVFLSLQAYEYSATALLSLLMLTLARLFPIITLAPFFGGKTLPHPVKVGFGLSLFAILLPKLLLVTKEPLAFDTTLLLFFVKELLIGTCIGLLVLFPFWAVESAGLFTDHQRGGASLMINDPLIQSQSSPLGTLYNLILTFLFFQFNGPFIFIDIIVDSYDMVAPDQLLSHLFFTDETPFWKMILILFNKLMKLAVQLASPALLAILMTDMFLGLINRMAPQVMITFLGMPLKSFLGLAVVAIGWLLLTKQFVEETQGWLVQIKELVFSFRIGLPPP